MPLRVLSAGSTLHGLKACAGAAATTTGTEIVVATDHGHVIFEAALHGSIEADVVLIPAEMAQRLAAKHLVRDFVALGTVGIGGAVRSGAAAPDISTMEALGTVLEAADAVLLTRAPTGEHLFKAIGNMGLHETVTPKLLGFDTSSKLLADLAARPDRALGFSPETEIRAAAGVSFIGEVPQKIQLALPYGAAVLSTTAVPETAREFLAFLGSPLARETLRRSGVREAA